MEDFHLSTSRQGTVKCCVEGFRIRTVLPLPGDARAAPSMNRADAATPATDAMRCRSNRSASKPGPTVAVTLASLFCGEALPPEDGVLRGCCLLDRSLASPCPRRCSSCPRFWDPSLPESLLSPCGPRSGPYTPYSYKHRSCHSGNACSMHSFILKGPVIRRVSCLRWAGPTDCNMPIPQEMAAGQCDPASQQCRQFPCAFGEQHHVTGASMAGPSPGAMSAHCMCHCWPC